MAYLIQGTGFGLAAAAQPGPFQTYIISQTLKLGWRRTLPAAFAPLLSDGPIIALSLAVLSRIPGWFERVLHLASGLFILYLAFNTFSAWQKFDETKIEPLSPDRQSLIKAALMNALSPYPYIYWSLVTGPILLAGWRKAPLFGIGFLFSFYTILILGLITIIIIFGTARKLGPRFTRILLIVSAFILAGFGFFQLWLGIAGIRAR